MDREGGEEEVEGEGGEISPLCESIGDRPLRGRCPKKGQYRSFLTVFYCTNSHSTMKNLSLIVFSLDIHLERFHINSKDTVFIFIEE